MSAFLAPGTSARAAESPAATSGLQRVSLQLPWRHRMQFAGFYMAKELGYYRQAGLDVEIRERLQDTSTIEQVVLGQADFGISSLVMESCLNGMPLVAVATLSQHSPFILLVPADAGIRGVGDLTGRTILTPTGALVYELEAMLAAVGLAPGEVQLAPLQPSADLIRSRRGDAVFCHRGGLPVALEQREIPFTVFHPLDFGVDSYGEILFVTRRLAERQPELVRAFREASRKGWIHAVRHMDEAVARVQAGYAAGADRALLDREAWIVRDLVMDGSDAAPIGYIHPHRWHDGLQAMARLRRLPVDEQLSGATLFDTFIAARDHRRARMVKTMFRGTLLAVLLLGGVVLLLVRVVRHQTADLARANLAIRHENEALKRAETILEGQHEMALALLDVPSEAVCLERVVAACLRFPHVDGCGVLRSAPGDRILRMQVCRGMGPEATAGQAELPLDSPRGAIVARGEPCRIEGAAIGDAFPSLQRDGWQTLVLQPVRVDHELIAVLCLGSRRDGANDWAAIAEPVATLLGTTLQRLGVLQTLRDGAALFRSVAEGAFDGIALLDTDGRFLYASPQLAVLAGYAAAELVGSPFIRLVLPEDREQSLSNFARRNAGEVLRDNYESRMMRRDGTPLPVMLAVRKVVWHGQSAYAVVYRDLSEQKRLETELLRIGEWEQIRIGQDLHDTIGQQLAGIAYLIGVLARNLGREQSAHAGEARDITVAADTAHQQLREVVQSLLPLPQSEGLEEGLKRLCDFACLRQRVACRLSISGSFAGKVNAVAANHLLCIAREAIANAVRHGNARHIEVALRQEGGQDQLTIEDDGTGFDPGTGHAMGSGLRIMGYRADVLGGKLAVRRRATVGMSVICTFNAVTASRQDIDSRATAPGSELG